MNWRAYRTNRREITCPACGHTWQPATTMFRKQDLTCPRAKCNREMLADYNKRTVTLTKPVPAEPDIREVPEGKTPRDITPEFVSPPPGWPRGA